MATKESKRVESPTRKHALDDREPIAPDGGWGWVILLGSFLTSVFVDGVCFSFGIFLLEFLQYFGESKGKTAWIGSVLNGTYMVMGPIVGALANRFGCRAVAISGSLISATAFFLSTFSPNVNTLIVTYGVMGGIGFGLMYLPSIVIVGFYFDKKRAFATGIATCGSGIGAFIFAPLCKFLIDSYGWRGAQWIVAAIVLNGIVLGALYRPLTFKDMEKMRRKWRRKQLQKLKEIIANDNSESTDTDDTEETGATDTDTYRLQMDKPEKENNNLNPKEIQNKRLEAIKNMNGQNGFSSQRMGGTGETVRRRTISNRSDDGEQVTHHLGDSWHSLTGLAASMDNIAHTVEERTGEIHTQKKAESSICDLPKEIWTSVSSTMDFTMLLNPVFVLYSCSCILCMAGFFIPFIYLPDNAIGLGYSSAQAAMLLSTLGITNTVGRVIAGWVSDRPWADCLLINNLALIIGGIATICCPLLKSYVALVIYACVFGLSIAAFVSLRSIILVDLIGLNKLTSAFGIIVLCQGLTSFVGAPIAGTLFDLTGSYDVSFYVAGTTIALAGVICLPLRRIARWHNNRRGHLALITSKDKDKKKSISKDTKSRGKMIDKKSGGKGSNPKLTTV